MATSTTNASYTFSSNNFFDEIFGARADQEIRMVLAGKTGEGKSAMGNAILAHPNFVAKRSMKSETSVCQVGERDFDGRRLIVVDTPGLFDTNADRNLIAKEIGKAVMMSSPGPHCFIVTISARNRFTEEAQQTVNLLCNIFGGDVLGYCIVVFTNEDAIIDEDMTFEQWLPEQTGQLPGLAHLINSCNRRCMAINSKSKSPAVLEQKVRQLVSMINTMVAQNQGRVYTNDMYKQAEKAAREREEEKLREAAKKDAEFADKIKKLTDAVNQTQKQLKEAEENSKQTADELKNTKAKLKRKHKEYKRERDEITTKRSENKETATKEAVAERKSTRDDTASESAGWYDQASKALITVYQKAREFFFGK